MKSLENQVALITGAGRARGMGRAAARKLAEHGADVVVTDLALDEIDFASLQETSRLAQEYGVKSTAIPADITDQEQVENCVSEVLARFGRIDILFNNAGISIGGPFLETPISVWLKTFDINLYGMVRFCRQVIPVMINQGGGAIINNSSLNGLGATPDTSAYTASKFAVIGLTKTLALEYASSNIRVNAVCPGIVDTDMGGELIEYVAETEGVSLEDARRSLASEVPFHRHALPEEIAEVVAFLASSKASYITGAAIPIGGGLVAGL